MTDVEILRQAMVRAATRGPVLTQLTVYEVLEMVSVIQLASRHPAARMSETIQNAVRQARAWQDLLGRREPEISRLLERGWHEVYDVPRDPPG